jgi:heptaprenyl diphosphate synthase
MGTVSIEKTENYIFQRVRERVLREMNHPYLARFQPNPKLDMFHMHISLILLQAAELPSEDVELLMTVVLLIHHGLRVHDDILLASAQPDERYRQLNVLAGDYFSSKYFHLLAQDGHVYAIGRFARAISRINEAKAEREKYMRDFSCTEERYMRISERIHGELLHTLREIYLPNDSLWEDIVSFAVRAYVLKEEYMGLKQGNWVLNLANIYMYDQASTEERRYMKSVPLGQMLDNRLLSYHVKYRTSSYLFRLMNSCVLTVERLSTVLTTETMRSHLQSVCQFISQAMQNKWKFVEQG